MTPKQRMQMKKEMERQKQEDLMKAAAQDAMKVNQEAKVRKQEEIMGRSPNNPFTKKGQVLMQIEHIKEQ